MDAAPLARGRYLQAWLTSRAPKCYGRQKTLVGGEASTADLMHVEHTIVLHILYVGMYTRISSQE